MSTNDKQSQKSGDGSTQVQAQNIIINNGIDEKRTREIFNELYFMSKDEYTKDAYAIADKRVKIFEDKVMAKFIDVENAINSFADPSFQFLLKSAQKVAASTEREVDYELLSELLLNRTQIGEDRNVRAGIVKAVEIIDYVSDEALLGLTVTYAISYLNPNGIDITKTLEVIDGMFEKLCYSNLPVGEVWIRNLQLLNAININRLSDMVKLESHYSNKLLELGIKRGSENYKKAVELLEENGLSDDVLDTNVLNSDYVILPLMYENIMPMSGLINFDLEEMEITKAQVDTLKKIRSMYIKDENLKNDTKERLNEEIDKYKNIKRVIKWYNDIPFGFEFTPSGKILARANASRFIELPPFNKILSNPQGQKQGIA